MRPSVFDVVIRRTGAATGAVAVALTLMALGGGWVSPREPGGALGVLDARASAAHLGATSRGRRDAAATLRKAHEARAAYDAARERASLLTSNAARLAVRR